MIKDVRLIAKLMFEPIFIPLPKGEKKFGWNKVFNDMKQPRKLPFPYIWNTYFNKFSLSEYYQYINLSIYHSQYQISGAIHQ